MFTFLHAADIHLDSPLRGLRRYDGAPVDEIRSATRNALVRLIDFAIEQNVDAVLIAGDLYDGDWKDYHTGLFMVSQFVRLREANIRVFLIAGNHDAENRMTKSLPFPENVHIFPTNRPEQLRLDERDVVVTGQGFASRSVTDDLSASYPQAIEGCFNIAMLHTCGTGDSTHAPYAPCTLTGLRAKGYDYWALGHVHHRQMLNPSAKEDRSEPHIVFPGNIQGRHIRETGPKGCYLVEVDDDRQPHLSFVPLDVFRWDDHAVDASRCETPEEMLDQFRLTLPDRIEAAEGLPLAMRVRITGATEAHESLMAKQSRWENHLRSCALDEGGNRVWIEQVRWETSLPTAHRNTLLQNGPLAELTTLIDEVRGDDEAFAELTTVLESITRKLPFELREAFGEQDRLRELLGETEQVLIGRLMQTSTEQEESA